uniref:Peptidase S1 domain-containing protein n=1 Tax=Podarcis muralis TaxID=64176 RepID=A0A670IAA4_PODMU
MLAYIQNPIHECSSFQTVTVFSFLDCGTRPLMGEMTVWNRIVGGRDAEPGAWPWQVSLQVYRFGTGYHHVCGGSVINNYSVLTAAHCIKKWTDPAFWRVVFGLHHLYNYESSTVKRHVRAIVMHSGFKRSTYENDVALFKLKRPISYSDYIQPICLPNSTTQLVADENPCFISGWGNTEEKGTGKFILQEAQVDVIPLYICNRYDWYAGVVSWNMLCAGSETGHVDSCQVKRKYFYFKTYCQKYISIKYMEPFVFIIMNALFNLLQNEWKNPSLKASIQKALFSYIYVWGL